MKIISREEWGSIWPLGPVPAQPQSRVVFHHAPERALPAGATQEQEMRNLRIMEDFHARPTARGGRGWGRGGYNFVAAESGRGYAMQGYMRIGAHVGGNNTPSLGILLMLDGNATAGSDGAWKMASWMVREGIDKGHLTRNPTLEVHSDRVNTTCPGSLVREKVRGMTLAQLLALTDPTPTVPQPGGRPRVGDRVWSDFFKEHLIVVKFVRDGEWYFLRESELGRIVGTRAQTPLSRMPPARIT
jgi:hypothetical protein